MGELTWHTDEAGTFHEQGERLLYFPENLYPYRWPWNPGEHPEEGYCRDSIAYFCPWCGGIWARMIYLDHRAQRAPFRVEIAGCAEHPDEWNIPGSILVGREGLLPYLPPAVLRRELEIHLKE